MAVTITASELADEIGVTGSRAVRLLPVATRKVQDYAPSAPAELQNEAVIRFAGYLGQSDYGTIQSETIGPKDVTYPTNHAAMFRNSGAASLLTTYKVRRAGKV